MPPDYVFAFLSPLHAALLRRLDGGAPSTLATRIAFDVALLAQLALIATLVGGALAWLDAERKRRGRGDPRVLAAGAGVAVFAFSVFAWVLHHRSDSMLGAIVRWDHWLLCALCGHLLGFAGHGLQKWLLTALSLVLVGHYVGSPALGIVGLGALVGWAAVRHDPHRPARVEAAIQGATIAAVVGYLVASLRFDALTGMQGWGLACWALMRHVSFVVEARRGGSTALADYLAYQSFFPTAIGAMEVYDEFAAANLQRPGTRDFGGAVRGALIAQVLMSVAFLTPVSPSLWLDASSTAAAWWGSVVWYLRGATFLTGSWYMIEAEALLLGFRVRPNFRGILTAESPAQFWRGWRGTMTHWLIRYVYVPLGGNRRRQLLNIGAVFAVSTLWHLAGLPFLHPSDWTAAALVPTIAWGVANFAGVAAHALWRRRWPAGTWSDPSNLAVRAAKIALTACFGSLTVTVLGYPFDRTASFPHFVALLLGLPSR